jgi:hypothetical protein
MTMRVVFASLYVLGLVGCDAPHVHTQPTPVAPTPIPTYSISGAVKTNTNLAVAGARVVVLGQQLSAATTDADGLYTISGVRPSPTDDGMAPLLSASKTGLFTDVRFADANYLPIRRDTVLDFALTPWAEIALGEVVQGQSPVGPRVCSHWGYGASECQRFGVIAPETGVLEVTLTAPVFNFDFDVVGPQGSFVLYDPRWLSPKRIAISVEAGSRYELRVIGGWSPARAFELVATMR